MPTEPVPTVPRQTCAGWRLGLYWHWPFPDGAALPVPVGGFCDLEGASAPARFGPARSPVVEMPGEPADLPVADEVIFERGRPLGPAGAAFLRLPYGSTPLALAGP